MATKKPDLENLRNAVAPQRRETAAGQAVDMIRGVKKKENLERVNVRISPATLKALEAEAAANGRTLSNQIRQILAAHVGENADQ